MKMTKELRGICAYSMDCFIRDKVDDEEILIDWLTMGVPDESDIEDCILYYGEEKDFIQLNNYFRSFIKSLNLTWYDFEFYMREKTFEILQNLLDKDEEK